MASAVAQPTAAGNNADIDPFAPTPSIKSQRYRYGAYDGESVSLYTNGSPAQAKRALEAHLAETNRRLQEASLLGSSLLKQRSELSDRLKEVEEQSDEESIGPELRQKLTELEREFHEVGIETARAVIPKPRVPSNESTTGGDASELEFYGGRESPSKVHPPSLSSRKQRNAAPTRVNDIKLATEISSSLLNQVRDLQAAYAEKDDALRNALQNKSDLETELESLMQRMRGLDESEQRYKDENWTLETRVQEMLASAKAANDRETKLNQGVKAAQFDKSNVERELEELKQVHGKLSEVHSTSRKQHEAEISILKRDATFGETERSRLQRKLEELTSQNQELAQAVAYKLRPRDPMIGRELTLEDDKEVDEVVAPEQSPPPSPTKGTPRHGGLELETTKSSLHHAHRMIQNLKNQLHREKTERNELRRLNQDLREEVDQSRNGNSGAKKRKSKDELNQFKKPARPDRLGGVRGPTNEVIMDEDWEDHDDAESPTRDAARKASLKMPRALRMDGDVANAQQTATDNDDSDDFETATEHEPVTESEAFHTVAENVASDSDDLTETEDKRELPNLGALTNRKARERPKSYQSTASTDNDFEDVRTPSIGANLQRFKICLSRGNLRKKASRSSQMLAGSPAGYKDSPASIATDESSRQSTPAGPSLFAELGDLSGSDDEGYTPSRSVVASREVSPEVQRKKPSPLAQSGENEEDAHQSLLNRSKDVLGAALSGGVGYALGRKESKDNETEADAEDHVVTPKEAEHVQSVAPIHLTRSAIITQETEPVQVPVTPVKAAAPTFAVSAAAAQDIVPETPVKAPSTLETSTIAAQESEPEMRAKMVPVFSSSDIVSQHTEPQFSVGQAPTLSASGITYQHTEPITPEKVQPFTSPLSISKVIEQYAQEPVTPSTTRNNSALLDSGSGTPLAMASLVHQETEPTAANEDERPCTSKRDGVPFVAAVAPFVPSRPASRPSTAVKNASSSAAETERPKADGESSTTRFLDMLGIGRGKTTLEPQIAEDETSTREQTLGVHSDCIDDGGESPGLENTRMPLKEIVPNSLPNQMPKKEAMAAAASKALPTPHETKECGTQTTMSSKDIDSVISKQAPRPNSVRAAAPPSFNLRAPSSPTRSSSRLRDYSSAGRPESAGSLLGRTEPAPPLPSDHRQAIAAAAMKVTPFPSTSGQMGPPLMPASAYRTSQQYRPSTANSYRGPNGTARIHQRNLGMSSPSVTNRSSVSSFASEIDQRFNISAPDGRSLGFDHAVDPRMIVAITQTMIGEFLWKYTRKPGRETQSNTRHRRFFWVHPYTRTLYWSEQDPASAGKSQLKAKSVKIHSVRVVSDDNAYPPGLHRKSIVVVTPGREIQFTAATGARHETWFNALSYLVLRTGHEKEAAEAEDDDGLTAEDVGEFNPRGRLFGTTARRSSASLRSHHTTGTRGSRQQSDYPTLTPNKARAERSVSTRRSDRSESRNSQYGASGAQRGTLSGRLSALAGSIVGASLASRYSGIGGQHARQGYAASENGSTLNGTHTEVGDSIYDASIVRSSHDSAEELRRIIRKQEEEANRLENVRACCDGKHDVGSLGHRHSSRSRVGSHRHSAPVMQRSSSRQGGTAHSRTSSQPKNVHMMSQ